MVLEKNSKVSQVSQCSRHFSSSFHPKGCVHLEVQVARENSTAEITRGQKLKKR